jgi:hypothetical protein
MKNYSRTTGLNLQQFISHFEELPKREKDSILATLKATMDKKKTNQMADVKPLRREVAYEPFDSFVII